MCRLVLCFFQSQIGIGFLGLTVILTFAGLGACIVGPGEPHTIQSAEKRVEVGVTRINEVIEILPGPNWINPEDGSLYYWGDSPTGFIPLIPVLAYATPLTTGEDDWLVAITFYRTGVVESVDTEWGDDARAVKERLIEEQVRQEARKEARGKQDRISFIRILAEAGSPKAAYELYELFADEGESPVKAWTWLCRAADQGYADAQFEAGFWQWSAVWELWAKGEVPKTAWMREAGIGPDDRLTYMWYTLASANGHNHTPYFRQAIASDMTPEEIAQAEQMARDWKPGDCPSKEHRLGPPGES